MYGFTYERPATLSDAARLAASGAKPLAGGQTLIASMKLRLAQPEQLVDLARVPGLSGVRLEEGSVVVGAMTRHQDVARDAPLRACFPALADLAGGIGDRQVRALGTIGGSVANNDPAACYPSAVLACGATVITHRREIPADDYFQGMFMTALDEGELIAAIRFPVPRRAAYAKLRQAASHFPLIGVFVAQYSSAVRVAVTGGGHGVFRHTGLEEALTRSFTPQAAAAVPVTTDNLSADLHASAEYRANLVSVMAQRAVAKALA
jgi:carbon-monoxide dehydrogenase medium subunit